MNLRTIAPVRKQITVEAPQQRAFDVFTARMGAWWKPDHHLGEQPFADVVIEPHEGGGWFERDAAGTTCTWGRVLAWEPPDRVVLAWQLDARWSYDPDLVTEVEVRFVVEGPTTTRVELEHRGLERMGEGVEEARGALDGPDGWAGLLDLFGSAVAAA